MVLDTAHRRGVKSSTGDLIYSNLPVSRETCPWGLTISFIRGVYAHNLPVNVNVIVGLDVVELLKLSM